MDDWKEDWSKKVSRVVEHSRELLAAIDDEERGPGVGPHEVTMDARTALRAALADFDAWVRDGNGPNGATATAKRIKVNGETHELVADSLSYEQVVALGGGVTGRLYSMVCSHRRELGLAGVCLDPGKRVDIHDGTVFTFVVTGNA